MATISTGIVFLNQQEIRQSVKKNTAVRRCFSLLETLAFKGDGNKIGCSTPKDHYSRNEHYPGSR
jgi:hypothetical protein